VSGIPVVQRSDGNMSVKTVLEPDSPRTDVAGSIEKIRRRLLDLSNRNRLLNFRHTKKSSLRLVHEVPDGCFSVLLDGGDYVFRPVPRPPKRIKAGMPGEGAATPEGAQPAAAEYARILGIDTSFDLTEKASLPNPQHRDGELQTLHYPEELESVLRSMAGAARLAVEETGSNMLYLVLGFLDWYESDDSQQVRSAPLLLVPLAIERGKPDSRDGVFRYRIRHSGEDVFANLCLQEKLRQDFGLAMPELETDQLPGAYLERISRLIEGRDRWTVRRQMTMTLLSFGKMLMYRDLDSRTWPASGGPTTHPRVREFFEGRNFEGFDVAPDYRIDEWEQASPPPVLIDDADSSQHSVLIDALRGDSLVVVGPPGTGKSQTITNLIAAAMAEDKRVLFVSEKLAALEVVRHRLDRAGLGQFCLELHSHKTQKSALIEDLRARVKTRGSFRAPALLDQRMETLRTYKTTLHDYAELIGGRFGALGQTVHELLWNCRRRRTLLLEGAVKPLEEMDIAGVEHMSLSTFQRFSASFADYSAHLESQLKTASPLDLHPWAGVHADDLTFRDDGRLLEPLLSARNAAVALATLAQEIESHVSSETWTSSSLGKLASTLDTIHSAGTDLIPALLPRLSDPTVRTQLECFCGQVRRYRTLRDEMAQRLGRVPTISFEGASECVARVSAVRGALPRAGSIADLRAATQQLLQAATALRDLQRVMSLFEEAGVVLPREICAIQLTGATLAAVTAAPLEAWPHRGEQLQRAGMGALVDAASRAVEPIRSKRAALASRLVLDFAPTMAEARRFTAAAANARWWKLFDPEWKAARGALATMSRDTARVSPARAKTEFQALSVYLEHKSVFEGDHVHREVAGSSFRGIDTPFDQLRALALWWDRTQMEVGRQYGGEPVAQALWSTSAELLRALVQACDADAALRAIPARAAEAVAAFRSLVATDLEPGEQEVSNALAQRCETMAHECHTIATALDDLGFREADRLDSVASGLSAIREMRELDQWVTTDLQSKNLLGDHFSGADTDLDRVFRTFVFADEVHSSTLPATLKALLGQDDAPQRLAWLRAWAARVREAQGELGTNWETFKATGEVDVNAWYQSEAPTIAAIVTRADRALSAQAQLPGWLDFRRARAEAARSGLGSVLTLAETGRLPRDQIVAAFEFVFLNSVVRAAFREHPQLARFSGLTHEQLRERFAHLDRETIRLERERIAARIDSHAPPAGVGNGPAAALTEMALIHRETAKQRRHIPIRQLVRRAGRALQVLKPCFMMGPLSVAQYLEPDTLHFDLVVMDEASQLRPEDALGAICRAKQVVVVGDPMQLPPTSFFDRIGEDEEVDEEDLAQGMAEAESILDIAQTVYRPTRMLRWHYRSRHADLIAYSNQEFYRSELVVFPSPLTDSPDLGIKFHHVANGCFEGRKNVVEARQVVDAVLRHARETPEDSLGVVTLNLNQRELIENELEQRLKDDPALQRFMERHREGLQPLFVKNLENVQGDERDAIVISATYGPDRHGSVFQRFGPINGPMGHRRLNVLFTRARKRVLLFSSLVADQIRVGPDSSSGLRALRGYLQFAHTGLLQGVRFTGREPDSDFEIEVASALQARGYEVVAQVGVAGFFIDLAVRHPHAPGRFLLGVECDGATYHSSRSARDRDRLREEILRKLQWRIERIWSTDWFRSPAAEIDRIVRRLEEALKEERERIAVTAMLQVVTPAPAATEYLTVEHAAVALAQLRETRVLPENPADPPSACILREEMIQAFLRHRPLDRTEWQDRIPMDMRLDTEPTQSRYLDDIFEILGRIV
jgi:very-short-patch-repair endonuclease